MKTLRAVVSTVAVFTVFWAGSAAAQSTMTSPPCTWNCPVQLPYGLAVAEVTDGGSLVTLEDGSIWEIRMPQRPVASSWAPGDFVEMRNVWAPVERFNILLAHGDSDYAEARFAGRKRVGGAAGQQ